jgi:hypothetical protein
MRTNVETNSESRSHGRNVSAMRLAKDFGKLEVEKFT